MRFEAVGLGRRFMLGCIFENDAIELGQVDVFALWIVDKGNWVFIFSALAQLHPFLLMPVIVVGLGQPISEVV